MAYVYHIICNGLSYVGVSVNWQNRLKVHMAADTYLGRALRKHGLGSIELLADDVTWEEALLIEIEQIRMRGCRIPNGYNVTAGGEGCLGLRPSDKAIALVTERTRRRNEAMTPEERSAQARKAAEASKLVTTTAEWAARRSEIQKERLSKLSKEERVALMTPMIEAARVWTDERRVNHKEAMKKALAGGKGWTPERRAAQAERMRKLNSDTGTE